MNMETYGRPEAVMSVALPAERWGVEWNTETQRVGWRRGMG